MNEIHTMLLLYRQFMSCWAERSGAKHLSRFWRSLLHYR